MKTDPLNDDSFTGNARRRLLQATKIRFKELFTRHKHDRQSSNEADVQPTPCAVHSTEEAVLKHLIEMASEVVRRQPAGVTSPVAAILRPLQAEPMLSIAERSLHSARAAFGMRCDRSSISFFAQLALFVL